MIFRSDPYAVLLDDIEQAINDRDYQRARARAKRALSQYPDDLELSLKYGNALLNLPRYRADALPLFRSLRARFPDEYRVDLGLGLAELYAGNHSGAIDRFEYVRERDPSSKLSEAYLAMALRRGNQLDRALDVVTAALTSLGSDRGSVAEFSRSLLLLERSKIALAQGRSDEAKTWAEDAVKAHAQNHSALMYLAKFNRPLDWRSKAFTLHVVGSSAARGTGGVEIARCVFLVAAGSPSEGLTYVRRIVTEQLPHTLKIENFETEQLPAGITHCGVLQVLPFFSVSIRETQDELLHGNIPGLVQ